MSDVFGLIKLKSRFRFYKFYTNVKVWSKQKYSIIG